VSQSPSLHQARPRVAVVGAGISGLTAAYLLQRDHHVTLFEAQDRLGGHAHTHDVESAGHQVSVDSGFIVLNDRTYPRLRALLAEIGVETRPTEMSMSVTCRGCGLGYVGGRGAGGIFGQRRRALDPRFLRLLLQISRFQKRALALLEDGDESLTYGEFLTREGFGEHFVAHYAIPVVSCVWSMGREQALAYPAAYLFRFLEHHGFLRIGDAPTWHTVVGGSQTYVRAVADRLDVVRRGAPVLAITRTPDEVLVQTAGPDGTEVTGFDKVVLAAHADESLAMLMDPTGDEQRLLGAFSYSQNRTLLHRDDSFLPAPRVRASWNYRLESCGEVADRTRVSYWMNRLQHHDESDPLVVTLNPDAGREPHRVIAEMSYAHPIFTAEAVAAQRELAALNDGRIAFAGAYQGWGFHEDGCASGMRAAVSLGAMPLDVELPAGDHRDAPALTARPEAALT
jgi:predicted NAD/FAD-binding protein